ncbi:MAG: hypothetical protein ACI8PQ_002711 [Planctomycetota bacterium]|jgi:hypothetical protein
MEREWSSEPDTIELAPFSPTRFLRQCDAEYSTVLFRHQSRPSDITRSVFAQTEEL